jgi:hypothetical protein
MGTGSVPGNEAAERAFRAAPESLKRAAKALWLGYARLTSGSRPLPDFLIIGAQRGGTSSLYNYLVRHPVVGRALTKEVRFFDLNFERGAAWYRSRFPSGAHRAAVERRRGAGMVVGEASPDYLFHPHVPGRVAQLLPGVKLIAVLRDPVERAHSHYWHQVARGFEPMSFEDAIAAEPERLHGELERMQADPTYLSFNRHHFSYQARGRYAEQLRWWFARFPRDRILILRSEDLYRRPGPTVGQVQEYLGLPRRDLGAFPKYGSYPSGEMAPATRDRLRAAFRSHNQDLAGLLERDPGWEPFP